MCTQYKLKQYLKDNNLTQSALANILDTSDVQINRWLNDKHKISKSWRFVIKAKIGI